MGAQITKELGVYNEEEKVCTPKNSGHQRFRVLNNDPRSVTAGITRTPIQELTINNEEENVCTPKNVGHQQYRMLSNDPRSVTAGITRTPIQVECTPTGIKALPRASRSVTNSNDHHSGENLDKKREENDSGYKEEEVSGEIKEENKCGTLELVRYLETDIDKVDSPTLNVHLPPKNADSSPTSIHHSTLITEEKPESESVDFATPPVLVTRTPHLVECTPELFALYSHIENLSLCDFDVHDDPSAVVSDDEQCSMRNQSTINKWLVGVENKAATPGNNSFTDSPKTVAKKQKELNALKKQLFFTPEIKISEPAKPKARTPLGDLQAGQLLESPQRVLKMKQWRNVAEERRRRGFDDTENTPPNLHLPPLTAVASAPGKIAGTKRTKINWDSENAMMI